MSGSGSAQEKAATPVVVAIDQGTSSTKAIVVDREGKIIASHSISVTREDPEPGVVAQDPGEIRDSVFDAINAVLAGQNVEVLGLGLSNQRESAVVWDRATGEPLGPLLGWQDRRTLDRVPALIEAGQDEKVRRLTGLPLDPMFSALKLQWLLDSVDGDRARSRAGEIAVGTVDSWLVYAMTGEHRIEIGNASRTQLMNLKTRTWDPELLDLFNIPAETLPAIVESNRPSVPVRGIRELSSPTRIFAVLGDSHAALYAHGNKDRGAIKITHGSGSSMMGLLGSELPEDHESDSAAAGLVNTIAWAEEHPVYAFEGTILSSGATLLWLAGLLGMGPGQLAAMAESVPSSQGTDLVPAFAGLGAPWWDKNATAVLSGFGLGTDARHLAHAAFDSIVLQAEELFSAAVQYLGHALPSVHVDGGPTKNDWLMQLHADISQRTIIRSNVAELSALGAAHMAGLACGLWTQAQLDALPRSKDVFTPEMSGENASMRRQQWLQAVDRSRLSSDAPKVQQVTV
ncbi:FGGY family carbohydrate kinase [Pseudarthrobacter oxydans]|uniref:FGGY-family carbohydrate kinase n=1 Tax=Pseudarthrobacter oxydans TaxID=1671 RepID=UPI003D27BD4D